MEPGLSGLRTFWAWRHVRAARHSKGMVLPGRGSEGGDGAACNQAERSSRRDLRVLYRMGICSVESLCSLRTPMSRGLPLLQGQEGMGWP